MQFTVLISTRGWLKGVLNTEVGFLTGTQRYTPGRGHLLCYPQLHHWEVSSLSVVILGHIRQECWGLCPLSQLKAFSSCVLGTKCHFQPQIATNSRSSPVVLWTITTIVIGFSFVWVQAASCANRHVHNYFKTRAAFSSVLSLNLGLRMGM